jgi:hypothetical protein
VKSIIMLPAAATVAFAVLSCGGESHVGRDTRSARHLKPGEERPVSVLERISAVTAYDVLYGPFRECYREWRYIGPVLTNQNIEIAALFPIPPPPTNSPYEIPLLPPASRRDSPFDFRVGYEF